MARVTARLPAAPEWVGLGAGAGALLVAHLAQAAGNVPCALCYVERWPYRVAILIAIVGLLFVRGRGIVVPMLVAVFLAGCGLALVHVGVEQQWWKSPLPECAAPPLQMGSIRDLLGSMPAHVARPCDDPTYLIPGLRVSMAAMNAAYALASAALIAMCTPWRTR